MQRLGLTGVIRESHRKGNRKHLLSDAPHTALRPSTLGICCKFSNRESGVSASLKHEVVTFCGFLAVVVLVFCKSKIFMAFNAVLWCTAGLRR